eukprot:Selendium_serpulae@DN3087_c0_g1_i1.p1
MLSSGQSTSAARASGPRRGYRRFGLDFGFLYRLAFLGFMWLLLLPSLGRFRFAVCSRSGVTQFTVTNIVLFSRCMMFSREFPKSQLYHTSLQQFIVLSKLFAAGGVAVVVVVGVGGASVFAGVFPDLPLFPSFLSG